jgi:hypothetical protein
MAAGITFFVFKQMNIISGCVLILKSVMRSSLDSYVLPGTATGTDILFTYVMQWKRDMHILCVALVYLLTFTEVQQNEGDNDVCNTSADTSQDAVFD